MLEYIEKGNSRNVEFLGSVITNLVLCPGLQVVSVVTEVPGSWMVDARSLIRDHFIIVTLDCSIWIRLELPGPLGGLAVRVEFKCFISAPFSIENGAETIENGGETIENGGETIENGAETIENGGTPEGTIWIIVRDF